jgi:hypothetical protein
MDVRLQTNAVDGAAKESLHQISVFLRLFFFFGLRGWTFCPHYCMLSGHK